MSKWTITLEIPDGPAPSVNLLRRVLKHLWRAWRIKVVSIREETP
jgi:hypothetical protein